MKKQGVFFGIVVKTEILSSSELTIAEKFVFSYVDSYNGACLDSNDKIADRLGLSVPTVSRSLKSLRDKDFVFMEYEKGNHARRKVYALFNKPNKKRTLVMKNRGRASSFPQTFTQVNHFDKRVNQNDMKVNQNDKPRNRGEVNQNDYHRIIRINKNKETLTQPDVINRETAGLAGSGPASRFIIADDFRDTIEFEREFYARNTFHLDVK